ncbi:MAG: thymidine phosphorylase [Clostridia bacterium]|nr:thymidine phosphorylase [Clostridia bacterium]
MTFDVVRFIADKRDGREHDEASLRSFVAGVASGAVPDYQVAAWCMAAYLRGLTPAETAVLTHAMALSGETVDLSSIPGVKGDKHSSGGVGDKATLVVAPLAAAAGVPMAKLSGRGLGHTGGTIDKLESIPGFRTALPIDEFVAQVKRVGLAVAAATERLVPADKRLYAIRDVTATVDSLPLIASSIMSKKIAGGADVIVLDVKVGAGAFVKDVERARELARTMIALGRRLGRRVAAVLSNMDQPLGRAVGNALEVAEAIAALRGEGPDDLVELSLELAGRLVALATGEAPPAARERLERLLRDGSAAERLRRMIEAQGGDARVVEEPWRLPKAPHVRPVAAPSGGYVARLDALCVGEVALALGAGRRKKEDAIDPAVGVVLAKKVGDAVECGEPWAHVHARTAEAAEAAAAALQAALVLSEDPVERPPLVYEVLE